MMASRTSSKPAWKGGRWLSERSSPTGGCRLYAAKLDHTSLCWPSAPCTQQQLRVCTLSGTRHLRSQQDTDTAAAQAAEQ